MAEQDVKVLTQANQYSVDTPVSGAGSLRAASAFRSSARGVAQGIDDIVDAVAVTQAEQAFEEIDQAAIDQASTFTTKNSTISGTTSGSNNQAAALKFNSEMARLANANPRVSGQIKSMAAFGNKNNPILTAQAALQKEEDTKRAKIFVEGTQLSRNSGIANPTKEQAVDAYMENEKQNDKLRVQRRTNDVAKLTAETAQEKQQVSISTGLTDLSIQAHDEFKGLLSALSMPKAEAEQLFGNRMDFSKFNSEEQYHIALKKEYLTSIALFKQMGSDVVNKYRGTGGNFKAAQETLNSYNKDIDNILTNISNDDILKMVTREGNTVKANIMYSLLTESPEIAQTIALIEISPEFAKGTAGRALVSRLNTLIELKIKAAQKKVSPTTSNLPKEEVEAASGALNDVAKKAKNGEFENGNSTLETIEAAVSYAKGLIEEFVPKKATIKDLNNAVALVAKTKPDNATSFMERVLTDRVVPDLKGLFDPLSEPTGMAVSIMSWLSTPGSSVTLASDTDPRKALDLAVTKEGKIFLKMGKLTEAQEVHREDLENIVTSFNSQSELMSNAMGYLAEQNDMDVEEATEKFLQDNFGIQEGGTLPAPTPTPTPTPKIENRVIKYKGK